MDSVGLESGRSVASGKDQLGRTFSLSNNTFRYHTKCFSKMIYQDIEEDYPQCKVEFVRSCPSNNSHEYTNMVNPKEDCRELEVMRCHIMKRTVRRGRPHSSCSRRPSKFCVNWRCEQEEKKCYLMVKMVKEARPEEECQVRKKRICQKSEDSECRTRMRRVCRQAGLARDRLQADCGDRGYSQP